MVPTLITPSGSKIHSTQDLAKAFWDFYSTLYNIDYTSVPPSDTNLPKLTPDEREALSQPISVEEISAAIASTPQKKTKGSVIGRFKML